MREHKNYDSPFDSEDFNLLEKEYIIKSKQLQDTDTIDSFDEYPLNDSYGYTPNFLRLSSNISPFGKSTVYNTYEISKQIDKNE